MAAADQAVDDAAGSSFDMEHRRRMPRLGGDRQLLRELITIFRADSPTLMAEDQRRGHVEGRSRRCAGRRMR